MTIAALDLISLGRGPASRAVETDDGEVAVAVSQCQNTFDHLGCTFRRGLVEPCIRFTESASLGSATSRFAFMACGTGTLLPPIECAQLPAALLECFSGSPNERLLALLHHLARAGTNDPEPRSLSRCCRQELQ